ncbi:MAG: ATP/GTP-binding protein [Rhizobiaceae bacterium]
MAEHVILVAGPMGAGKTTAIQSLSEVPVVSTEAANTEIDRVNKATTTVALDYGEISLDDTDKIRLYGVPGQRRFDFMWRILEKRAVGLIVLVNNDTEQPLEEVTYFMNQFASIHQRGGLVVGVTRSDLKAEPGIGDYLMHIEENGETHGMPIFTVDPRNRDHMVMMLFSLLTNIQSRAGATDNVCLSQG